MAHVVQATKKIALLHRHPIDRIKETNAAFPELVAKGIKPRTFRKFNRSSKWGKFFKSILWIFYAPMLVIWRHYDVIYCDDSYPFYPYLVKLVSPKSKIVIRLGDLHLLYNYAGRMYRFLHRLEMVGWNAADKIIVISKVMQEHLIDQGYGSEVVLDPIALEDFVPMPAAKTSDKIVMFHGVITKNKNIDLMIEAAKRLPELWFWVVGEGPDLGRLRKIAPKNVYFSGWHPHSDIASLINNCNVGLALRGDNPGNDFVVTSPFLQYGAMSKPCLVTKREVFGDYPWQFIGVNKMVGMIKYLIDNPKEGRKLQKFIIKRHDSKKIAGEIWKILQQVTEKK